MTTIYMKRFYSDVDVGFVEKVDGEVPCSMVQLLGGRSNVMRSRRYPNGYSSLNAENPWVTEWRVRDIYAAFESIQAHGCKYQLLEGYHD